MIDAYRLAFTDSLSNAFRPRGAPGRWNSRGVVVIYTAEHPALAGLEMLNAWSTYSSLSGYHLYRCRLSEEVVLDMSADLDATGVDVEDLASTRSFGNAWIRSRASVALRVPSVVAPMSFNYLLNPDHPHFERAVQREAIGPFEYDDRVMEMMRRAKDP